MASLLLIHGLYPVDLEDARARGARQGAAVHGVPRRRRRARRASTDGVARLRLVGPCNGCPASAATLEWRSSRRSRRRRPTSRAWRSRASQPPPAGARRPRRCRFRRRRRSTSGWRSSGAGDAEPGALTGVSARPELVVANVDGTCSPTATLRRLRRGARARRRSAAATLTCPRAARASTCRSRAARGEEGSQLAPVPLLRGAGPGSGWRWPRERPAPGAPVAGRAGCGACAPAVAARAAPPAPSSAASCAARVPSDHRHLLHLERAADPLRLRAVLGDALGRGRAAARRDARASGTGFDALRRALGARSRSRSAWRSSASARSADGVVALYPSPGGGDGVRARPRRRGTSWWSANPVLADLEPEVEALIVDRLADPPRPRDRADRPLLRARGDDQGALGGDLRRATRSRTRSTAFFARLPDARSAA